MNSPILVSAPLARLRAHLTRPRTRLRRTLLAVSVAAASVLGVLIALAVGIALYGHEDRARPADVIIVLGGGSPATERRARHAAALYARDLAPVVLCSGGYRRTLQSPTEAEQCAAAAREAGVPAAALVLEPDSLSTRENAEAAARLMAARGWQSAVLVTDDFHLWRAVWMFRRADVTVWPSPAQATQSSPPPLQWTLGLLREVGAVGWTVLDDLRARLD